MGELADLGIRKRDMRAQVVDPEEENGRPILQYFVFHIQVDGEEDKESSRDNESIRSKQDDSSKHRKEEKQRRRKEEKDDDSDDERKEKDERRRRRREERDARK